MGMGGEVEWNYVDDTVSFMYVGYVVARAACS